jgi:hypothetical protein
VLCVAGGLAAAVLGGDDGDDERAAPPATRPAEPQVAPPAPPGDVPDEAPASSGRLAVGLSDRNAFLLGPASARRDDPAEEASRARVDALNPAYFRLMIDWSQLPSAPDGLAALLDSDERCRRDLPPCQALVSIRKQLRAVAAQQRAAGAPTDRATPGAWEVVTTFYGVPPWAARRPGGCERPETQPRSRPINDVGLAAFRGLIRQVDALARAEGVELRWWAPWNEPNQPFFVSPQRPVCDARARPRGPGVYARLVRAARAELRALGGDRRLVLGELAGFDGPRPFGAGIAEFVAALPDDVACAADVWGQHAYAEAGAADRAGPVGQLKRALDRRRCTRDKPIWVTETGVGGARSGEQRDTSPGALRQGCRFLDALLRRWYRDPRVEAAFQYTYREDPNFPVGLADGALTRVYPTYRLWREWGGEREPEGRRRAGPARPADRGECRLRQRCADEVDGRRLTPRTSRCRGRPSSAPRSARRPRRRREGLVDPGEVGGVSSTSSAPSASCRRSRRRAPTSGRRPRRGRAPRRWPAGHRRALLVGDRAQARRRARGCARGSPRRSAG